MGAVQSHRAHWHVAQASGAVAASGRVIFIFTPGTQVTCQSWPFALVQLRNAWGGRTPRRGTLGPAAATMIRHALQLVWSACRIPMPMTASAHDSHCLTRDSGPQLLCHLQQGRCSCSSILNHQPLSALLFRRG